MFCASINIFWFFLCAALVAVDVSQQWTQPNGESLLPSRWNDLELKFLHSQHSDKLTGLQLSRPDQALRFSHVDEICAKIEFLDAHSGILTLHNGVSIGHRKHAGFQRVCVAPFPGRRFHESHGHYFLPTSWSWCWKISPRPFKCVVWTVCSCFFIHSACKWR